MAQINRWHRCTDKKHIDRQRNWLRYEQIIQCIDIGIQNWLTDGHTCKKINTHEGWQANKYVDILLI